MPITFFVSLFVCLFVKKSKRNALIQYYYYYTIDGPIYEEGLTSGIIFLLADRWTYIPGLITGRGL